MKSKITIKKVLVLFSKIALVLFAVYITLGLWVVQEKRTLLFDLPADQNVRNNMTANSSVWMVGYQAYITSHSSGKCVVVQKGATPKKLSKKHLDGMATDDYLMISDIGSVSVFRRNDGRRVFRVKDTYSPILEGDYLYMQTIAKAGVSNLYRYNLRDGTTQTLAEDVRYYCPKGERLFYRTMEGGLVLMDMTTGYSEQIDSVEYEWTSPYFLYGDAVCFSKPDGVYTLNLLDGQYEQVLGTEIRGMQMENLYDGKLYLSTNKSVKSTSSVIKRSLYRVQTYDLTTREWGNFIEMPLENISTQHLTILREGAYILQLSSITRNLTQIVVDGQVHTFG